VAEYKLDRQAKYATTHEWVRIEDGIAVVGISDAAQDMLSDVVFVELPEEGATLQAGTDVAVVESVKAAEDIVAPVSGTVVAVNRDLEATPELVNQQPYAAWFFKVQPTATLEEELAALMSPDDYAAFVAESGH
jgi:glycine cleavage system H protein